MAVSRYFLYFGVISTREKMKILSWYLDQALVQSSSFGIYWEMYVEIL